MTLKKSPRIYILVGRFNPVTKAHEYIIKQTLKQLKEDEYLFLFLSSRTDDIENPLDVHTRGVLIRSLFRDNSNLVIRQCTDKMNCIMDIVKAVNTLSSNITVITDADRKEQYEILLNKYNNIEYSFDSIETVIFDNNDFINEMSATNARLFALEDEFVNFCQCLPNRFNTQLKQHLFDLVRSKLSFNEETENEEPEDLEDIIKSLEQYSSYSDNDEEEPTEYTDDYIKLNL